MLYPGSVSTRGNEGSCNMEETLDVVLSLTRNTGSLISSLLDSTGMLSSKLEYLRCAKGETVLDLLTNCTLTGSKFRYLEPRDSISWGGIFTGRRDLGGRGRVRGEGVVVVVVVVVL